MKTVLLDLDGDTVAFYTNYAALCEFLTRSFSLLSAGTRESHEIGA